MSRPEFYATPGYVDGLRANLHYAQAVRIGDRVGMSGQCGWQPDLKTPLSLEDEIVQAFDNVERTLATARADWHDVTHGNSYHISGSAEAIGDGHNTAMMEQPSSRMGDRTPI